MEFNREEYNRLLSDIDRLVEQEERMFRQLSYMLPSNEEAFNKLYDLRKLQVDIKYAKMRADNYLLYINHKV